MRVRWTTDAANDLERMCDYIAESRPESARRVAQTIVGGIAALETFPNRGRPGRVEGTRDRGHVGGHLWADGRVWAAGVGGHLA